MYTDYQPEMYFLSSPSLTPIGETGTTQQIAVPRTEPGAGHERQSGCGDIADQRQQPVLNTQTTGDHP
jgi:hypothetical protein